MRLNMYCILQYWCYHEEEPGYEAGAVTTHVRKTPL